MLVTQTDVQRVEFDSQPRDETRTSFGGWYLRELWRHVPDAWRPLRPELHGSRPSSTNGNPHSDALTINCLYILSYLQSAAGFFTRPARCLDLPPCKLQVVRCRLPVLAPLIHQLPSARTHHGRHQNCTLYTTSRRAANPAAAGNCLFNALADQLYGSQDRHHELRHTTVEFIRTNKDTYKHYFAVNPGGATRRQPKRKTAPSSKYQDAFKVTDADIDRAFETHLTHMAKGGTWGDNLEIAAFALAMNVNVKQWEHYSSVRNLDGPHTGLPLVQPRLLSPQDEAEIAAHMNQLMPASAIHSWQIEALSSALNHTEPRDKLVRALQESRGNIDDAWNLLFKVSPPPDHASFSSAQSSSIDEDDSSEDGPVRSKRQDRRLSKATKSSQRRHAEQQKYIVSRMGTFGESLDSLIKAHSTPNSSPSRSTTSTTLKRHVVYNKDADDTEDEDWHPSSPAPLKDGDTSSSSEYSEQAPPSSKIMLKLPRPSKFSGPTPKRLGAARDMKSLKKQAQKQAARERKQAQFKAEASRPTSVPMSSQNSSSSTATMTLGLKTVYL
ncbi:hypothetical protein FH972_026576 [Carpinus fangiana]|uniref:OTU domain-containing protein n=1 Tax=Carpinus fangiana TaxID=176857 RepID=A0A5N6L4F6_9ROSI|nr:hypothetical protein FH972_026576 [Carpinus fangiana]